MTQTPTPTPASVQGPSGASGLTEPSSNGVPRRSSLTQNTLPSWLWIAMLGGSLVLGAALSALFGFNLATWFIFTAVIYILSSYFLTRTKVNGRRATDGLWTNLVYLAFLIALMPLISVIWSVASVGIQGLMAPGFLSSDMQGITGLVDEASQTEGTPVLGGIFHALIGSLLITLAATVISVPIGLLTSIYLVEYAKGGPLSRAITFFVDVMTGIPSIVAGLFAGAAMAWFLSVFSGVTGLLTTQRSTLGITAAIALSVLMVPVVVRTTEEMLRVVPNELREASYALGVRKWRTILKVVLPTAISGIASGVTLAIARVIGETAPILVTAGFVVNTNWNLFQGWMTALPVYIFRQFQNPTSPNFSDPSEQRAWAAALVLILIVMGLNLFARLIAKFFAPKQTGR
ncbi:phosphate ABC transporter permease PstA [Nesterenkonia sp. E16_7]|uniref:phosphate ABC transporter permease PstA n=1 Tax=unclassified Nesterenkonia TaxID=2629769 RepID=UPI001A922E15|nr:MULTISPECIES: phosphate ABC transporter permease PstA [unclassified Nesterenkonia]MBO0595419.1 phosphate ABC transporter permease PstA [Nesterenkonia sp. E16_10]MBO0599133.1 phosphate ABC transporter permease PstA [Nesterenkonia sp. E16_7]